MHGIDRVLEVYPVWLIACGLLVAPVVYFDHRTPRLILGLVLTFLVKDVILDCVLADISRPRVYWAEHAPILFWVVAIGLLDRMGVERFKGYVGSLTLLLAGSSLLLDLYTDLVTSCSAYGR